MSLPVSMVLKVKARDSSTYTDKSKLLFRSVFAQIFHFIYAYFSLILSIEVKERAVVEHLIPQ